MKSTIIEFTNMNGRIMRKCIRCGVFLDHKNDIDIDYYTARQYLKIIEIPESVKCKHSINELCGLTEHLLTKIKDAGVTPELGYILESIVHRLPQEGK